MREAAARFVRSVSEGDSARLTANAEVTPYALCFRVFLAHLLKRPDLLDAEACARQMRQSIREVRETQAEKPTGKPYRQLLTFTLSALSALGMLEEDPLEELVLEQLPLDVRQYLDDAGSLRGQAGAGNQAMFLAIFLLHAQRYLGQDCGPQVSEWVDLHLNSMNGRGFWSPRAGMTHLEFQNGYHQYEIFEYLDTALPALDASKQAVAHLADVEGHFAPYPGGGGCHDYDAVFVLTYGEQAPQGRIAKLLQLTARTLLGEQNEDGGFGESQRVRPWQLVGMLRHARHVFGAPTRDALIERGRYWLALSRPRNARIHTHWSRYSRRWNESDLWDTWFRMMAIARIDVAFAPERARHWGFIDYPGIGYHASLRHRELAAK
ncbi:MAG: hypothetical protein KDE68_02545 [Rhodocyclaceae bacterium]|nr:hypothetical protein [Rhodocyclaceae bacterium]